MKSVFKRFSRWEFWSMWCIYHPLVPVWSYLSPKSRSFFFFSTANPLIANGGMARRSKGKIYGMIPAVHIPKTLVLKNPIEATKYWGIVLRKGLNTLSLLNKT